MGCLGLLYSNCVSFHVHHQIMTINRCYYRFSCSYSQENNLSYECFDTHNFSKTSNVCVCVCDYLLPLRYRLNGWAIENDLLGLLYVITICSQLLSYKIEIRHLTELDQLRVRLKLYFVLNEQVINFPEPFIFTN